MSYDHDTGLAATWATSVDRLTPDARRLLERLAFLAPEPIPDWLLDVAAPGDPEGFDARAARAESLRLFARLARVGRDRQGGAGRIRRASAGAGFRAAKHDGGAARRGVAGGAGVGEHGVCRRSADVRTWPVLDPLARACSGCRRARGRGGDRRPDGEALRISSINAVRRQGALQRSGAHVSARAGDRRGSQRSGPSRGGDRLNNLAELLRATNRLGEAEPLYRRALAIDEASYGPDHPKVATDLNNLAALLYATNRLGEAEPLYRRALAIDEASYRAGSSRRGDRPQQSGGIAACHEPPRRGRAADAPRAGDRRGELRAGSSRGGDGPQQSRGLALRHEPPRRGRAADAPRAGDRRGELRAGSSRTWRAASTISRNLLRDTNRLGEAEPLIGARWRSTRRATGRITRRGDLPQQSRGTCFSATNRLGEAELLYRRALAIDEASYGPDHPDVATELNNLAGLLRATNRLGEAEPLYRRALAIDEASYGPNHPEVATRPQQSGGLAPRHEPRRRGRAALSPRAGDLEASYGDHPEVARPQQSRLASRHGPLGEAELLIGARWRSSRRATGRTIRGQRRHAEPRRARSLAGVRRVGGGRHPTDRVRPSAGPIGPSPSSRFTRLLRSTSPLRVTAPCRGNFLPPWSLVSEPARRAGFVSPKTMEAKGLSRAQGSRLASATAKRLGLDAEHGSGSRGPSRRPSTISF